MALIKEVEVEFGEGLNIMTGETGAGRINCDRFCEYRTWNRKL